MTHAKPPSHASARPTRTNANATSAVLAHSTLPTLVFAAPIAAPIAAPVGPASHDADVVDLRALDVPVSELALRNAVRAAWRRSPLLTVRVDGAPSAQVLALLHGLVRGELRWGPTEVERFDERHRVVALTDAHAPSPALLALFVARVRSSPGDLAGARATITAPKSAAQKSGSTHAR